MSQSGTESTRWARDCFKIGCLPFFNNVPKSLNEMVKKRDSITTPVDFLTAQQKKRLKRTWDQLSVEVTMLGMDCMTTLWQQCPEVPAIFELPSLYTKDLLRNPHFHQHACWLVQSVSAVVENVNSADRSLADTFIQIGVKHAAVPHFPVNTFAALPKAWATVWDRLLCGRFTGETEKSWAKVFFFISSCLTEGYQQCTFIDDVGKESSRQSIYFIKPTISWQPPTFTTSSTIAIAPEVPTEEKIIPTENPPLNLPSEVESEMDPKPLSNAQENADTALNVIHSSTRSRRISKAKQRRRMRSQNKINQDEFSGRDGASTSCQKSSGKKKMFTTYNLMSNLKLCKKSRKAAISPTQASFNSSE